MLSKGICHLRIILTFLIGLSLYVPASDVFADSVKHLKVGVYSNPPKLMLSDQGELSGILGDLLVQISEQEGWQLQPVPCEFAECLDLLRQGEIDILPDVAMTQVRAEFLSVHTEPALLSWSKIYARRDSKIRDIFDLENKRIAVVDGSVQQSYLIDIATGFDTPLLLVPVPSFEDGFKRLLDEKVDAVASNQFFGDNFLVGKPLESTPIVFMPTELYYGVAKGTHKDVLKAIDVALKSLKANSNSVYFEVLERYMPVNNTIRLPKWIWYVMSALVLLTIGFVVFNRMLTRRVAEKTHQLEVSEKRLEVILNSVDACIFIKDCDLNYQYANQRCADLLRLPVEQITGYNDQELFSQPMAAFLNEKDRYVLSTGKRLAYQEQHTDAETGEERLFWSVKVPLTAPDGRLIGICGIATDVSEYEALKSEVQKLANFDPLTNLGNRRTLIDRLAERYGEKAFGSSDWLMFIDIDQFKTLNDRYGHDVGDQLLSQVGERIKSHCKDDEFVGRLGADEFYCLSQVSFQTASSSDLKEWLNQLMVKLEKPFLIAGEQLSVSFSVGVVSLFDCKDYIEAMKAADLSVQQAKVAGGRCIRFFNEQMQEEFNHRQVLLDALKSAISMNQLSLAYQPQFCTDATSETKRIGFEALLRWVDEEKGYISPGDFIPLAESNGLMPKLNRFVMEQVMNDIDALSECFSDDNWVVAINVSASQIKADDFLRDLKQRVEAEPRLAQHLELEITESVLIDDIDAVAKLMREVSSMGIQFALDDFGTGYSSLIYLKLLPFRRLKIDQGFVRDLLNDRSDEAIVKTVIALANGLGLETIAEGVETEEQQHRLVKLGCYQLQGFYLGRPEPLAHWQKH
ncbi:signal protein [Idiomarina fontislapidosi]|uniref:Signal protein n=1 Tax=Idiomarina fontislapidosi TaxID=263723 RepID=A0A432XU03_9GAMM|nr:signal protein [Idiomarina fontislapidosi]